MTAEGREHQADCRAKGTSVGDLPDEHGQAISRPDLKRAVSSSFIGSVLEWYDFYLYGAASSVVFAFLFFPSFDPVVGTLASFGSFGVAYLARPVGGLFFGSLADRIGRKKVLIITMVVMGLGTAAIGVLPTYDQAGVLAPILLLVCRLLQGFAAGGEFASAVALVVESSARRSRGLLASIPGLGVGVGIILSTGAIALMKALLSEDQFLGWGWRIPFIASLVVLLIGAYVRSRVKESPTFEELKEVQAVERAPLRKLFRTERKALIVTIGARFADLSAIILFQVWILSYLTLHLDMSASVGFWAVLVANIVGLPTQLLFGALSDRIGRKPVFMGGAVFIAVFLVPFFFMLETREPTMVVLAITLINAIGFQAMFAVEGSWFLEMFDARTRVAGYASARELTSPTIGATAPIIATAITAHWAGSFWPVVLYMMVLCAVTIAAVAYGPETNPRGPRTRPWRRRQASDLRVQKL